MNKNNKKYYKSIKKALDCNFLMKHYILKELKNNIDLYEESHAEDSSSVEQVFGTSKEIACKINDDYFYYKTRKLILRIFIAILIIAIILFTIYLIINIIEIYKSRTGTYTVRIR